MYIPSINAANNREESVAFMQRFSFATIITAKDNLPVATHLPFVVTVQNDTVVLTAHFAKANPHWNDIEKYTSLVIFSEPHAYISPTNYNKEMNVPTWNYIAVHAYGKGKIIAEPHKAMQAIESVIDNYETAYKQQWNSFPEEYKNKMLNGIVAFEMVVTDLQAKKKLSQNRTEAEQHKIIETLTKSNDTNAQLIADYMKGN
jgi:transcriptional regulator